ncbi:MAG: hypothetical protein JNN11_05315 [Candidatus Doudnabacteria bacterium]|nr:hypothetical protein [Candidatus Doudnabacteria bacterium]
MESQTTHEHSHHQILKDLEAWFHKLYLKVPFHLPTSVKEFIVRFGPWITLVLILLALPALLAVFAIGGVALPFAAMSGQVHWGGMFIVNMALSIATLVLEAIALPYLFKKQIKGWNFMFYAVLVSAIGSILSMNLGGLVIGTAISLYILFEIKSYYK